MYLPFRRSVLLFCALFLFVTACERRTEPEVITTSSANNQAELTVEPNVPDWHKDAVIYEVNTRIYTPEGTFDAFREHLPRLAEMGVDILWFMPIHPVSEKNRKGTLGSPYAVADYRGVNPDFGTKADFKELMEAIHAAGMHAIIDWVPNHTGWDNPWITAHPDFYTKKDGEITDPINPDTGESWGWTDVADLNYDNAEMRDSMIDAMAYWVKEMDVDGFRVDVAHGVPVDFWEQASSALYAIEPLFLLSEGAVPAIVNNGAFIMDYGWEMHHTLNEVAKARGANRQANTDMSNIARSEGEKMSGVTALAIDETLAKQRREYHRGYKMQFTSNHDENAWAGTEFQRMGDGHQAFAVLTATFDGMPLIYSGQESAVDRQYEFFEKDQIEWGDYTYADFYRTLFDLKERNQALWNGEAGGPLEKIETSNDEMVYAFTRAKNGDKVAVLINLSAEPQRVTLDGGAFAGTYTDVFSNSTMELTEGMTVELEPWGYRVLSNK
ncbi:alpha-amylase family glycosyl hydrolase [Lewinella sp. JB7]|uniref:alpha-amylase family glycosyl hydrolase n=1 Tax=Lewinella sp. JB7 TaxID=2962887 RepID=UPI0020CA2307|nr:alpha-amylase family glycosyl hydrolase [Lewinella sp. JB7]MCP9236307.1 alpha-amylase family glycosyl hydrolase [Lewinella sp. JB7]